MSNKNIDPRFDLIIGSLSMSNLSYNELHEVLRDYCSLDWETEVRPFCKRCDRNGKASAKKGSIKAFKR